MARGTNHERTNPLSNRDPEATYSDPVQSIEFAIREWVRSNVRTAVPGIVRAYDARTMRARVQPALRAIVAMPEGPDEGMDRAPIFDVPVIWPGGGGYLFHCPLNPGDTVWMMFSERGITEFKNSLELADPPAMVMFATCDAVVMPWRAAEIAPAEGHIGIAGEISEVTPTSEGEITSAEGATIQSDNGAIFVSVRGDYVKVKAPIIEIDGNVTVSGDLSVVGGMTNDGTNVGRFHRHQETGTTTGPPQ